MTTTIDPRTISVPAPRTGKMLAVAVFLADRLTLEQTPVLQAWREIATLPREGDGRVILASAEMDYDHAARERELKEFALNADYGWQPHPDLANAPFGWAHGIGWRGIRHVDEIAEDHLVGLFADRAILSDDRFEIHDISELSASLYGEAEVCAVLRLTLLGRAQVYLDRRARCDHALLLEQAASLFATAQDDSGHSVWRHSRDGSLVSAMRSRGQHPHLHT